MPERSRPPARALAAAAVVMTAAVVAGCGGSSHASSTHNTTATTDSATTTASHRTAAAAPPAVVAPVGQRTLPAARSGTAAAAFGNQIVVAGGLSDADVSTDTVFSVPAAGAVATLSPLPSPIHDAAAAPVAGRLLVFGGGISEGSDHILQVLPGPSRQVGTLPQALSDLVAVPIGGVAYVTGGWNGSETNSSIYAVGGAGGVRTVGHLPIGVRYPAAGTVGGRLLIAGGELTSGDPTTAAWSFDPATGAVTGLPRLTAPTDHAASAVLNGRLYILGGVRRGVLTRSIISWAPGQARWQNSGELPVPLADASAVGLHGEIELLGGRTANGRVRTITLLAPR